MAHDDNGHIRDLWRKLTGKGSDEMGALANTLDVRDTDNGILIGDLNDPIMLIKVTRVRGESVRVAILCDRTIKVMRSEVVKRILAEREAVQS